MTTYESVLAMFILPTDPEAVAVISVAFGGILINSMFPFLL